MVNSSRINFLLTRYADADISEPDYQELMGLLQLDHNEDEFLSALDHLLQKGKDKSYHTSAERAFIFEKLLLAKSTLVKQEKPFKLRLWMRYTAAASLFFILSIGILLFINHQNSFDRLAGKKIVPARDKAYLYMSDGSQINLDTIREGKIINQEGVSISKSSDGYLTYTLSPDAHIDEGMENSVVTPKGGHFQINLPDGTRVWLNADSKLTFPIKFSSEQRSVRLQGEAYFEVAKQYTLVKNQNSKKTRLPFYVFTANQRLAVLGTHFNVHAYADDKFISTTLLEGAVALSLVDQKGNIYRSSILKPGEQGVNDGSTIKIQPVDIEEQMGWKNGLFIFNGQNLAAIMKEVSRWYDIDIVFENESLKKNTFSGSTSRFKDISSLFEVLESTGSVHFKIDGRRVFIKE